jgi:3-oxoacyl-[acyl-carrier protein] reductase
VSLAGRVIVVTGGSRGIGRACVLEAVRLGAKAVFCSRHDDADSHAVERVAAELGGAGAASGVVADVAVEADVARLFSIARDRYGRVDGVVSNAAISRERLLVSTSTEEWDDVVATNLTGGFMVVRQALREFLEHGRTGRIVIIGTLSQYGVSGNASYASSKGGLLGLTRELALRYGNAGITTTMVVPGYVETALSAGMSDRARRTLIDGCPQRRPGSPAEIAAAVAHLLADGGGLNGRVIRVSGGLREVPL